jgi:putative ABC transport system permease protein
MNLKEALRIALTNLTHRRLRSLLTLVGIFAGIAAVVALVSLGQGLQGAINDQFSDIGADVFTMTGAGSAYGPPGTNAVGKLTDKDITSIERVNGVKFSFGRYIKPLQIEYQGTISSKYLASLPEGESYELMVQALNVNVEEGRMLRSDDKRNIVVGGGFSVGDKTPQVGERVIIKEQTFRIVGKLKKTGNPFVDPTILMTKDTTEELFNVQDDYSIIVTAVNEGADLLEVRDAVERQLRKDRGVKEGEEDFSISTPQETLESLNSILMTVQVLIVGIAAISLLVGAIGIANTMYTAILERRREIGIMKSVGAKNNDILIIFLIESGLLGLVGGIIGLLVGIGISKGVEAGAYYYFGESLIKATIPFWLIAGSLSFAFILGTLSGTLPARQASQLKPVDALRK